jgi:flagellar protein FlaG
MMVNADFASATKLFLSYGVIMSVIDGSTVASSSSPPVTPVAAPKPVHKVDQVFKNIRAVSEKTEQVNTEMAQQKTRSVEEMGKMQARLQDVIRTLNESIDLNPNKLQFSVDSVSNKILVVVTDEITGEVVRQVPAEALLRVAHNLEAMKGILFDKML